MIIIVKSRVLTSSSFFFPQTLDPLDWGGAGCKYRVFYRPNTPNAPWTNKTSFDRCDLNFILERGVLTNQEYEVRIRTENIEGPGPMSPSIFGLSGQNRLFEPPTDITVVRVNASSVEIKWTPFVPKSPQSVDGHYVSITNLNFVTSLLLLF